MSVAYRTLKKIKRGDRVAEAIAKGQLTLEEHKDHMRIKRLIKQGKLPRYLFEKDAEGNFPKRRPPSYLKPKGKIDWNTVDTYKLLTSK